MQPPELDLTGKVFTGLTVVSRSHLSSRGLWYYNCRCECGNELIVRGTNLLRQIQRSCGCRASYRTHGLTGTPTAKSYGSMMDRCYRPTDPSYAGYGGRGLTVCERWHKIENFVEDMGLRPPGKTLDRKDNDKGYSKENCRWATHSEQQANKRNFWIDGAVVKPHGRPTVNLIGKVFGKLTVVERVYTPRQGNKWRCVCECGGTSLALSYNLMSGNSTTCGDRINHPKSCPRKR